jgi:hypothetical protein
MNTSDTLRIHYSALSDNIRKHFEIRDERDLAFFATDIQTCSFLVGDPPGYFEFIHKSFMEFFTAVYVKDALSKGHPDILAGTRFHSEVLFFLGDFVYHEPELKTVLRQSLAEIKDEHRGIFTDNLLGLLGYSRSTLSDLTWSDVRLDAITCVCCELDRIKIDAPATTRIKFDRSKLRNSIVSAAAADVTVEGCTGSSFDIRLNAPSPPAVATDTVGVGYDGRSYTPQSAAPGAPEGKTASLVIAGTSLKGGAIQGKNNHVVIKEGSEQESGRGGILTGYSAAVVSR